MVADAGTAGPAGFEQCTPDLLRRHPTICHDQPYGDPRRRIVGQHDDGTCEYHEHLVPVTPSSTGPPRPFDPPYVCQSPETCASSDHTQACFLTNYPPSPGGAR